MFYSAVAAGVPAEIAAEIIAAADAKHRKTGIASYAGFSLHTHDGKKEEHFMKIRNTEMTDWEEIQRIYAYARMQMKKTGNPTQWGDYSPEEQTLLQDIEQKNSYVVESNGKICGVFSFVIGEDPTYLIIEDGQWKNKAPYGTIHRLASDGTVRGMFEACLLYCKTLLPNIRIDTHYDNRIMQHLIEKNGFQCCGIIYIEDGSPRIAYQWTGSVAEPMQETGEQQRKKA